LVRKLRFILGLGLIALLAMAFSGVVVSEAFLHPHRHELIASTQNGAASTAESLGGRLEDVQIAAADGVTLKAWFFRARQPSGKAVILLHGQADHRGGMLSYVPLFLARQYDVLAIDSRAQGESGGAIATYGLREAGDLKRWVDWLVAERGVRHVFGVGESMGAAILLQTLRDEPRFEAVAAESSFSSLREVAYDRIAAQVGCGGWLGRTLLRPVVESGFWYARLRYGVKFEDVSPAAAVASTRIPILLIHGAEDTNIPPAHSRRILNSARGRVELWEVPQAGHSAAFGRWPAEFERRVAGWFESAISSKPDHPIQ
jgi:uncharacterized protein